MPRLIAFLRAINVGGHTVTMAELRKQFEALGLKGVETFIASGNVIFSMPGSKLDALEKKIEDRLHKALGFEVATFLRTDAEVASIARYRPFTEPQLRASVAFNIGFLQAPLGAAARKAVTGFKTEIDDFHVNGREIYWLCKRRQSESTFSNAVFERALKGRSTFRQMTTIVRLTEKYALATS
jgi:uncharacterized protein (DUF1697 family)